MPLAENLKGKILLKQWIARLPDFNRVFRWCALISEPSTLVEIDVKWGGHNFSREVSEQKSPAIKVSSFFEIMKYSQWWVSSWDFDRWSNHWNFDFPYVSEFRSPFCTIKNAFSSVAGKTDNISSKMNDRSLNGDNVLSKKLSKLFKWTNNFWLALVLTFVDCKNCMQIDMWKQENVFWPTCGLPALPVFAGNYTC